METVDSGACGPRAACVACLAGTCASAAGPGEEGEMCRGRVCALALFHKQKLEEKGINKRAVHFRSSQSRSYGAAPLEAVPRHEVAFS